MYLAARGKSVDLRKGSQHVVYRSVDLTRRMHDGVDDQPVSGRERHLWIPERGEVAAGKTRKHKIVILMYLFHLA
jgi:hypothetical protein